MSPWEQPFRPVDGASLAVFRMAFGLCVLIGAVRYVAYGWVDLLYRQPTFFFTWPGFDWVRPWPGVGMYVHYGVIGAFAALLALGLCSRVAAVGVLATFAYVELIDKTNYLNHYWLVTLLAALCCALPMGATWSLDARRRPERASDTVPAWAVWALRGQLGVVYFFAGVAKLDADWLLRGQPLGIWLSTKTDTPVVGPLLDEAWVAVAMSWGGAVFDLTVPFLLLWRRTRVFAYALVLGFHVATGMLFNIGMFPVIMVLLTPIFFDPSWPREALSRLRGRDESRPYEPPANDGASPPQSRIADGGPTVGARFIAPARGAVLVALGLWFAVQVALPLRHLAYPGDVRWTQEGWRFSWRVLLVESRGFFKYRVVDPDGRTWVVRPEAVLDSRQRHVASSSPDMILHYAHHLAERFAADGHPDVAVYADAWLSKNGEPSARFVDPERDLSKVPRTGLGRWDWVLPPGPSGQYGKIEPAGHSTSANRTY